MTQRPAPTLRSLEIPDPSGSNNWATYSTNSPPAAVLPTRGRGVRVNFYAPVGGVFGVSLRDLTGTSVATLTENTGTPAPPEDGYFQTIHALQSGSQAIYRMYVRAPSSLMDPANYDIEVVDRSVRSDQSNSKPMVVPLRNRPVYTVTVEVIGSGHVTSSPGGIECGTAYSGAALTRCSYEFGAGTVTLTRTQTTTPTVPPLPGSRAGRATARPASSPVRLRSTATAPARLRGPRSCRSAIGTRPPLPRRHKFRACGGSTVPIAPPTTRTSTRGSLSSPTPLATSAASPSLRVRWRRVRGAARAT